MTIPELGTIKAEEPPIVIITSNRTREIHDALKRRCLYHWVDYPDAERELEIVRRKVPGIAKRLSREVVAFVQAMRKEDLFKAPGVAETLDWATALTELDAVALDPALVSDTLGVLLKYQDDIARMSGSEAKRLLDERAPSCGGRVMARPRWTAAWPGRRRRRPTRREHRLFRARLREAGPAGRPGCGARRDRGGRDGAASATARISTGPPRRAREAPRAFPPLPPGLRAVLAQARLMEKMIAMMSPVAIDRTAKRRSPRPEASASPMRC